MQEDVVLLEAARNKEEAALVAIFDKFAPLIYKYALRLCQDQVQADNVVGDVFVKLLEQFAEGKGPRTNIRSYMYQMAYHIIVDQSRVTKRVAPLEVVELLEGEDHPVGLQVENRALLDVLLLAMENHLSEDQQHVVVLRFLEGFSLQETAEIVGKEVNNIKVIQNRGIAKLRQILQMKEGLR